MRHLAILLFSTFASANLHASETYCGAHPSKTHTFSTDKFSQIEVGMQATSVHSILGKPSCITGSGIPYDVYVMKDGPTYNIAYGTEGVRWVIVESKDGKTREHLEIKRGDA